MPSICLHSMHWHFIFYPTGKDQLYVVTHIVDLYRVKDRFIGERRIGNYVEGKDRLVLEIRFLEGLIQSERCQDWALSRLRFEPHISRNCTALPLQQTARISSF